jgi:alpha-mannosidase
MPYPDAELTRARKGVLFNQFHDALAGTATEAAYDDVRDLYGEALTIAGRALNHATQAIARRIDASGLDQTTWPIVVFNPHTWAARLPVEVELGGLAPAYRRHR